MERAFLLFSVSLAVVAGAAWSDPIPNASFAPTTAGWFDAKGRTCPQICERHTAMAEKETNTAPPVADSYVCKVRKAGQGPYFWLFGTQFGDRPACYTTGRDLKGEYSDVFYCLCVKSRVPLRKAAPGADDGR